MQHKFSELRANDHWARPGFPNLATLVKCATLEDSKPAAKTVARTDAGMAAVSERGENKKRDLGKCDSPSDDDLCSGASARNSSPVKHSDRATKKKKALITGFFRPLTNIVSSPQVKKARVRRCICVDSDKDDSDEDSDYREL